MKEKSFIRREKQVSNFTILPNDIFKHQMSLKAIGLLCFLLHLPEDWVIVKTELHKRFKDGRDATTAAFNELIFNGYITEEEIRAKGKFAGKNFFVHDVQQNQPLTENPLTVNPSPEKPSTENPTLLNTNNKKVLNNKAHSINSSEILELTGDQSGESEDHSTGAETKSPPDCAQPPRTNYVVMMEIYYNWFKGRNDQTPPKIDGAEGKALKATVAYLVAAARARITTDKGDTSEENVNHVACESFNWILKNWGKLDAFTQKQVKLAQINSNLSNIINFFKNGKQQQSAQQAKADRSGTIETGFEIIENAFRGKG